MQTLKWLESMVLNTITVFLSFWVVMSEINGTSYLQKTKSIHSTAVEVTSSWKGHILPFSLRSPFSLVNIACVKTMFVFVIFKTKLISILKYTFTHRIYLNRNGKYSNSASRRATTCYSTEIFRYLYFQLFVWNRLPYVSKTLTWLVPMKSTY